MASEALDFIASISAQRISRAVLDRVEAHSFTTVKLSSDSESLRQFDHVFADSAIRTLVKTIRYDVVLPVVSDKRLRNKFQSTWEASENSRFFTEGIVALFARLHGWETVRGVELILTATSPSDDPILRTAGIKVKPRRSWFKYIGIDRNVLPAEGLLPVSCISSLGIQHLDTTTGYRSGRRIHPDALDLMATPLPCLENAICDLHMPPRRMPSERQYFRTSLARAFLRPPYSSLTTLTVILRDPDPRNEEAELQGFSQEGQDDDLSLGIRRICELPTLVLSAFGGGGLSPRWCSGALARL